MIKAGIFDVGGVLLQGSGKSVREQILQSLQIKDPFFNRMYHMMLNEHMKGRITEKHFWKELFSKTGVKKELPSVSLFAKHGDTWKRNDDIFKMVRKLKADGLKVAILSNVIAAFTNESRKNGGIYEEFHEVILSCEVGMSKPDPEIYKYTLQKLEVRPSEAFFVDDLKDNVNAAKNIGMHAFQYKDMKTLIKDLEGIKIKIFQQ